MAIAIMGDSWHGEIIDTEWLLCLVIRGEVAAACTEMMNQILTMMVGNDDRSQTK
jgi:hypothetical protein